MSGTHEPGAVEQLRIGPIKVVELYIAPVPDDSPIAESLGNQTVPFDQVRHLVSSKPLGRFEPAESAG